MQVGTDPYPITAAYSEPNSSHAGQAGLVGSKVDLTRSQTDASRPMVRLNSFYKTFSSIVLLSGGLNQGEFVHY